MTLQICKKLDDSLLLLNPLCTAKLTIGIQDCQLWPYPVGSLMKEERGCLWVCRSLERLLARRRSLQQRMPSSKQQALQLEGQMAIEKGSESDVPQITGKSIHERNFTNRTCAKDNNL